MKSKTITYYDMEDIKKAICIEMDIDFKYFRCYHELVGGKYKDLWHEWLDHIDDRFINDTIVSCSYVDDWEDTPSEDCLANLREDDKWVIPFINAVYVVMKKYDKRGKEKVLLSMLLYLYPEEI